MQKKIPLYILLLLSLVLFYGLGPYFPDFFTSVYNKIIYPKMDYFLSFFTYWIPFSLGDVLYATVILFMIYKTISYIRKKNWKKLVPLWIGALLLFFSLFQLLWGLNNYKYSVVHQLQLNQNYSQEALDTLTNELILKVNELQLALTNDSTQKVIFPKDLALFNKTAKENYRKLPGNLQNILTKNYINDVKPALFSTFQSYTGFSGYFNPFTHENQVNIEIPVVGMPVTVAHEMAHQLGISSETEANFFGYQNMAHSADLRFQYAANLYALKYCLKEYHIQNEEMYLSRFQQLHSGVQQNILESEAFWMRRRNISSFLFKHLYGRFLKINNQKDGIKSYNKFVDLLINYNKKYPEI